MTPVIVPPAPPVVAVPVVMTIVGTKLLSWAVVVGCLCTRHQRKEARGPLLHVRLRIDDDGEETEKKEGDDDGKGPSVDTSTRNDGERRDEEAEIAVETYEDDGEIYAL